MLASTGMPVRDVTAVLAPSSMLEKTRKLFRRHRTIQSTCANVPYRTLISSSKVCALGALRFASMAIRDRKQTMVLAEAPHQTPRATP